MQQKNKPFFYKTLKKLLSLWKNITSRKFLRYLPSSFYKFFYTFCVLFGKNGLNLFA